MLNKIRIKNLRSLVDTNEIELKPLTLLVGKNSSGKSTFLRFFPLMKQTFQTKTNEPVLWYSTRDVDFGSFSESLNKLEGDTICFEFNMSVRDMEFEEMVPRFMYRLRRTIRGRYNQDKDTEKHKHHYNIKVSIECKEKYIERFTVFFEDSKIEIILKGRDKLSKLIINDVEFDGSLFSLEYPNESSIMFPRIVYKSSEKYPGHLSFPTEDYFASSLVDILKKIAHANTKKETLVSIADDIYLGTAYEILNNLKSKNPDQRTLHEHLSFMNTTDKLFTDILINVFGININRIISFCNIHLRMNFTNVRYIAPIRARAERYYRIQGLSVDETDPQGENIPMILQSMPEKEKNEFNTWTSKNFGFEVTTKLEGGHTSLRLKYDSKLGEINLADTGFGYSQILPIMLMLWKAVSEEQFRNRVFRNIGSLRASILVIEQPELHLHPALQAKLMDTFIQILVIFIEKKIDTKIIIETHSETMINRIGQLLAQKTEGVTPDLVNVLIFNQEDTYRSSINVTTFTDEGYLKSWPIGFFSAEDDDVN